jgi:apolipoprotein N-acyltransferase
LLPALYNVVRWRQIAREVSAAPVLEVAVVQPNIPQEQKWSRFTVDSIYEKVNELVAEAERTSPDLIVAPEASLPLPVRESTARLPDEVAPGKTALLIGALEGIDQGQERRFGNRIITVFGKHHNAAILAAADRTVIGASDKRFLVPVTEQIPYKSVFGFLLPMMSKQFGRMVAAGNSEPLVLPTSRGPVPFGALVCYEALFPSLCRDLRNHGARFLAVITNDAWFGRTSFPYQHLGIAVLRAIENRTSIVRSANTGISSITDPLGRTRLRTAIFEEAKLDGQIALTQGRTFYTRAGDLVLYVSYPMLFALLAAAWVSHRRARTGART